MFASNKDIALISTIIGLIDHFTGPITVVGIVLLTIMVKSTGNLKLGLGEKSNRKTGNHDVHTYSRSSSRSSFRGGSGSSGGGDSPGRW